MKSLEEEIEDILNGTLESESAIWNTKEAAKKINELIERKIESLREIVIKGISEDCVRGYGEIKYCDIRNGDGNGCKRCMDI